ncbi:hypothetical protein STENM327S_02055 [Streptomyces tendae]
MSGSPCVAYADPAAISEAVQPASEMPSCSICPFGASL